MKLTVAPDSGYAVKECFFTINPTSNELFAILPEWPRENKFKVKNLKLAAGASVKLVETGELIEWTQVDKDIVLKFPQFDPRTHKSEYAYAVSIEL